VDGSRPRNAASSPKTTSQTPASQNPGSHGRALHEPAPRSSVEPRSKGLVRPDPRVALRRLPVPGDVAALARHVWIPRWDLPAGETVHQPVLEYPGANVVVEPGSAALHGPHRSLSTRELRGRSWAVGVLLRPAAGTVMTGRPMSAIVGAAVPVPGGGRLAPEVREAMAGGKAGPGAAGGGEAASDDAALAAVVRWLRGFDADEEGLLINAIVDEVEDDPELTRVADVAARFGLDERRLQRLCHRRIGYPPKWLIMRRRLQEAAYELRRSPLRPLADLALELGYSDQAHFARDFAAVIGMPPGAFRAQADP